MCVCLMLFAEMPSLPLGKGAGPQALLPSSALTQLLLLSVPGHTGQMCSTLFCSILPTARPMAFVQLKVTQGIQSKVMSAI